MSETVSQPCDKMPCADDEYCVNDSNSATAFRCEKAAPCGCADPAAKCGTGKTCKSNKCQPMPRVMLPVGVLDGTPGCVRIGRRVLRCWLDLRVGRGV
jgi:hypothetical protein